MAILTTNTALDLVNDVDISFVDDFTAVLSATQTEVIEDFGDSFNFGRITITTTGVNLLAQDSTTIIESVTTTGSLGLSISFTDLGLALDDLIAALSGATAPEATALALMFGGADQLNGSDAADLISGFDGADILTGGLGGDVLNGGDGFDMANFADAGARVQADLDNRVAGKGEATGDTFTDIEGLIGSRFGDNLRGDNGANLIQGGNASDRLYGRAGDDTLEGGNGADAIFGNGGADELTGGAGRDRFIYFNTNETRTTSRDVITDFSLSDNDRIEISRFDADLTTGGNQVFDFVADAAFTNTAGELRYEKAGGITVVQGDQDGDGAADFEIELTGEIDLIASSFLL